MAYTRALSRSCYTEFLNTVLRPGNRLVAACIRSADVQSSILTREWPQRAFVMVIDGSRRTAVFIRFVQFLRRIFATFCRPYGRPPVVYIVSATIVSLSSVECGSRERSYCGWTWSLPPFTTDGRYCCFVNQNSPCDTITTVADSEFRQI